MDASLATQTERGGTEPDAEDHEGESAATSPDALPLSEVFNLLSNARRRRVLRVLRDRDGSATLSEIAEIIGAWENDKEVSNLTSSERKRTYVGLYQCHLPKMDDSDVVKFDKHRGDIRFGPNAPLVFEYLETEETRPWARYYLALAGVWGGIFLLGWVGNVSVLASPVVIALQLFTFSLCGVLHYRATDAADDDDESLASLVESGAESE